MPESGEGFINRSKFQRSTSHAQDELQTFRTYLKWMCVDQSNYWSCCLSWSIFILFNFIVPSISHYILACDNCDGHHRRPYDWVIQLSLSSVGTLSFLCLSRFVRRYGLRRFLFFDKLCDESEIVSRQYTTQLKQSMKFLSIFVLPCFVIECAYKIWWYASGASQIPFLGNVYLSDSIACLMELCSWLYRTTIIFLVCVLFHLICHLQILRLQDFAQVFQSESDVGAVLSEHLRIRRHLRIISHRYRQFIVWSLVLITGSQFTSLILSTKDHNELNIFMGGELALCSLTLVTALLIILRSAAKITHKALGVTCLASKWHVSATLDTFDITDHESPPHPGGRIYATPHCDFEGDDDEEDELDNTNLVPEYSRSTISFQKRQALVTYFENNGAGITIFGFILDRFTLHMIFGLELSLVLWTLGKTIGLS